MGVKRLALKHLLSSAGCGIDHSEPHRLQFNVAILVTGGSDEHMVDFSTFALRTHDLLLLRAGQVHAFGKKRACDGEILTFTPDFLASLEDLRSLPETVDAIFEAGPCIGLGPHSAGLAGCWYEDFSTELSMRGTVFSDARILHAFGLLIHRMASLPEFALAGDDHFARPRLVRQFQLLLEQNFLQRREPGWYADQLFVSARTLDRQLVKSLNQTCKELIRNRLLLEAKRLLTDPDLQVKNVAYALRFEEVGNFSRFFHQNAGVTPREFKTQKTEWAH